MTTTTLNQFEHAYLDLVNRHLIGLSEAFAMRPDYAEYKAELEQAALSLEQVHGYLVTVPLFGHLKCHQLTKLYCRSYGKVDRDARKELIPRRKKRAYALLQFCVSDETIFRQPLTGVDFETVLSDLLHPNIDPRDYYLADGRLGYFILDLGREESWHRLLRNCVEAIVKTHRPIRAFAKLLNDNQFELGVVTPHQAKAKRLRAAIKQHKVFDYVPWDVLVVPQLREF